MTKAVRSIALVLILGLGFLFLTACGSADTSTEEKQENVLDTNKYLWTGEKKLADGRTVACVVYANYHQGGLSCDWANAK